ncbi:hypothetical protein FPZ49_29850 [Paenibacillus cremeus]|uniref:Copper resistance protein CopC n=2 Tax=Paenibacillus cremeus TaxID=2163881 RepID=A0A559K0A8_9BACL|nr:hypothetical protein FPZ49_29850 [Paenibacillus cremeus]
MSWVGKASAHASLVDASPAVNAELQQAPGQIALTFNERLEDGLYYIRIFDTNKKRLTDRAAVLNETHTVLSLELPKLGQGNYIVTYHVISADGHPIDGTYLFAVGQSLTEQPGVASQPDAHNHMHGGLLTQFTMADAFQFATRIAFYLTMLVFTGWVLWQRWFGSTCTERVRDRLKSWGDRWQQAYLICYILFMWTHLWEMVGDSGGDVLEMFTQTTVGYAWIAGLLLALMSFVVIYRSALLDLLLVALIWIAKSFLGHAAAFEPRGETILLDALHLGAAAVWAGGLVMMLALWRAERESAKRFFASFTLAALLSILLLIVSGVLSVFIFLPNVTYIVETEWGKLLLAKTGLVLLVVVTAALIRWMFRRRKDRATGVLIRIDAVLMALIIGIVGVFTYLTPVPANQPLSWHVMGEKIHMTTLISPAVPGVNDFTVKVWLPESLTPKQVILKLQEQGSAEIAPIEVPVEAVQEKATDETYGGLKQYTYKTRGAYLPYPGHWNVEVRVLDSNDDETVYDKQIRVY